MHFEMAPDEVPTTYQLLEIEFPECKGVLELSESALPEQWQTDIAWTRAAGDEWRSGLESCLLRVLSAIAPHCHNYLFSPGHELAVKAKIITVQSHPFDSRLK